MTSQSELCLPLKHSTRLIMINRGLFLAKQNSEPLNNTKYLRLILCTQRGSDKKSFAS